MGIAAGVSLGEVADAGELPVLEDAVGDAQPAHISRLVRCAVEQTVKSPAEVVVSFRRLVVCGLHFQPLIAVERMQLALELLWVGKLLAFFDEAILRAQMSGIGSHGFGRSSAITAVTRRRASRTRDLQSRHEAFQIALLFGIEFAGCRL